MKRWREGMLGAWLVVCISAAPLADADAPPGRYTISAGTVRDNATGLTWQQSVGPDTYTWEEAEPHCRELALAGNGWRLPTKKELLTLVDPTVSDPAIDLSVFRSTPSTHFWSSSPYLVPGRVGGWLVNFLNGTTMLPPTPMPIGSSAAQSNFVRCVR